MGILEGGRSLPLLKASLLGSLIEPRLSGVECAHSINGRCRGSGAPARAVQMLTQGPVMGVGGGGGRSWGARSVGGERSVETAQGGTGFCWLLLQREVPDF